MITVAPPRPSVALPPSGAGLPAAPETRAVDVRPLTPADTAAVRVFLDALTPDTAYRRFFTGGRLPERMFRALLTVDQSRRDAAVLVASGRVVGLANYVAVAPGEVELAVVLSDEWQGRGFGPWLAEFLLGLAARRGARWLRLCVQAGNSAATRAVHRRWPDARAAIDGDLLEYRLSLDGI